MSDFLNHAKRELDLIGMTENSDDEINQDMRKCILDIIQLFANQGHSGFSAGYAVGILEKLLRYEPLAPLTGEDSEWNKLDYDEETRYQNNRCSRVFKDADGRAYDIEGKVFWEWFERDLEEDEPGYPDTVKFKSHFTSKDSRVYITFPYTPQTVFEERINNEASGS